MARWKPEATHEITVRTDTEKIIAILRLDTLDELVWDQDALINTLVPRVGINVVRIDGKGFFMDDVEKNEYIPRMDMSSSDPHDWRFL